MGQGPADGAANTQIARSGLPAAMEVREGGREGARELPVSYVVV